MKIFIVSDGVEEEVCELSSLDLSIFKDSIVNGDWKEDLKRRLEWVIKHKIEVHEKEIKDQWLPKLIDDPLIETLPATREGLINLILSYPPFVAASSN